MLATQALQGLIPVLNISQNNGSLESRASINIRGTGTIGQGDRNRPSIIMWSIGNEIAQRADEPAGQEIAKRLVQTVMKYDTSRFTTVEANDFRDRRHLKFEWDKDIYRAFNNIDVAGYNYMWWKYESDHKVHPDRIIYGSELSYVKIEIVDKDGNVVPNAAIPVKLECTGNGNIIASGNAAPDDMKSFLSLMPKTFRGKAIAIIQPNEQKGEIKLTVSAEELPQTAINIQVN